jgi:hypothetical protein
MTTLIRRYKRNFILEMLNTFNNDLIYHWHDILIELCTVDERDLRSALQIFQVVKCSEARFIEIRHFRRMDEIFWVKLRLLLKELYWYCDRDNLTPAYSSFISMAWSTESLADSDAIFNIFEDYLTFSFAEFDFVFDNPNQLNVWLKLIERFDTFDDKNSLLFVEIENCCFSGQVVSKKIAEIIMTKFELKDSYAWDIYDFFKRLLPEDQDIVLNYFLASKITCKLKSNSFQFLLNIRMPEVEVLFQSDLFRINLDNNLLEFIFMKQISINEKRKVLRFWKTELGGFDQNFFRCLNFLQKISVTEALVFVDDVVQDLRIKMANKNILTQPEVYSFFRFQLAGPVIAPDLLAKILETSENRNFYMLSSQHASFHLIDLSFHEIAQLLTIFTLLRPRLDYSTIFGIKGTDGYQPQSLLNINLSQYADDKYLIYLVSRLSEAYGTNFAYTPHLPSYFGHIKNPKKRTRKKRQPSVVSEYRRFCLYYKAT